MLLRVIINNFLSFYHPTEFNMFPNPKREFFNHHINTDNSIPLLRQTAVYGENGSGKSNFIKVFAFLKSFCCHQKFLTEMINLEDFRFQLSNEPNLPINIEVEFCYENRFYIYQVSISSYISEKFYKSGLGKKNNELVFSREANDVKSRYLMDEKTAENFLEKNSWSSLLSLNENYPIFSKSAEIDDLDNWIHNIEIININSEIPTLIDVLYRNHEMYSFTMDLIKEIGLASLLYIKNTPLSEWMANQKDSASLKKMIDDNLIDESNGLSVSQQDRITYNFIIEKGEKIVQEFIFEQLGVNGFKKEMKYKQQSDGTVRLLTLIPAIYKAIFKNSLIIIDEIENSIHPNLIYSIVKYFSNHNPNGQLIFSTHLTRFQNQQDLMRPDEIWTAEKHEGCTSLKSLNDFNIHRTMNIEKGYIEGRYGAIPNINIEY